MSTDQRVSDARVRLHRLESDCRLTPAEVDRISISVLGAIERPKTLGQAHRFICALEEALHRVSCEIPW